MVPSFFISSETRGSFALAALPSSVSLPSALWYLSR